MKKAKVKPKAKESGHWKPALWATPKVRRYVRHVRKYALTVTGELEPDVFGIHSRTHILELFDGVISRREISARGYKTLGEVQGAKAVDGITAGESVDAKQQAGGH